jgi:hypothetical protein
MRSPASAFAPSPVQFFSNAFEHGLASTRMRIAAAALGFAAVVTVPVALLSSTGPAVQSEPKLACETIDWRVGEKLTVLREHNDPRTRAIVNSTALQRATAQAQCRAGAIDEAMDIYRVLDRALTRYVQYGTAPSLPK